MILILFSECFLHVPCVVSSHWRVVPYSLLLFHLFFSRASSKSEIQYVQLLECFYMKTLVTSCTVNRKVAVECCYSVEIEYWKRSVKLFIIAFLTFSLWSLLATWFELSYVWKIFKHSMMLIRVSKICQNEILELLYLISGRCKFTEIIT